MNSDKKVQLIKGKEYYCWFSQRILEFVGWFQENKTPYVVDNYNPLPNMTDGKRTWCWKYLRETTQEEVNKYKNDLYNKHSFKNFKLVINEDNTSFLINNNDNSVIYFETEELEKVISLKNQGYIKKY